MTGKDGRGRRDQGALADGGEWTDPLERLGRVANRRADEWAAEWADETYDVLGPLDDTLVLTLARAARLFTAQVNDDLLLAGLTGPQWLALHEVVRERSVEPSEVARLLGTARPTATEVLARLLNQGLVTRQQAYADGRLRVYQPTGSGARAAARGVRQVQRATARATDGFTTAERAQLVRLLQRVARNLAGLRAGPGD